MDDDRLERLGRGEDQPPREGQPALPRGAPPARPLVADAHRGRADAERRRVPARSRARSRPRARGLSHASRTAAVGAPVGRGEVDDQLVLVGAADPLDRRAPDARTRRHDPQAVEVAAVPDRGAVAQAAAGGERRPDRAPAGRGGAGATARARRGTRRSGRSGFAQPRRVGGGTVTTTPRSGWITTRRPRDRGERRRVYGERAAGQPWRRRRSRSAVTCGRVTPSVAAAAGPARSPVSAPSTIAGRPLTMTWSMPIG